MNVTPKHFAELCDHLNLAGEPNTAAAFDGLLAAVALLQKHGLAAGDARAAALRLIDLSPPEIKLALEVDQRTPASIMNRAVLTPLPDGRRQVTLPHERPLEKFHPHARWTPRDVVVIRELMTAFYASPFGLLSVSESLGRGGMPEEHLHPFASQLHELWASDASMLIAAEDSFVDMLEAAATTAPEGALAVDELLADSGMLIFQSERMIPRLSVEDVPIRGIVWKLMDTHILVEVLVDGHHEQSVPASVEPPVDNYAYLYVMNHLQTEVRNPELAGEQVSVLLQFLRSIKAIAKAEVTTSVDRVILRKGKKGRRAQATRVDTVRVLSLRAPDHGRYELEAATGRKVRQHWVRGHWRRQWYATLNDHRSIWIEGFIKGDAQLGLVGGPKVYLARAPKAS